MTVTNCEHTTVYCSRYDEAFWPTFHFSRTYFVKITCNTFNSAWNMLNVRLHRIIFERGEQGDNSYYKLCTRWIESTSSLIYSHEETTETTETGTWRTMPLICRRWKIDSRSIPVKSQTGKWRIISSDFARGKGGGGGEGRKIKATNLKRGEMKRKEQKNTNGNEIDSSRRVDGIYSNTMDRSEIAKSSSRTPIEHISYGCRDLTHSHTRARHLRPHFDHVCLGTFFAVDINRFWHIYWYGASNKKCFCHFLS